MTNCSVNKAIILVAGEGTRLRPYTQDRPKCLVEINGKSLLSRHLSVLNSVGVNDIILIGGYRYGLLRDFGLPLYLNEKYAETNMLWTLFCAEQELTGNVLLAYGDIVYSKDVLESINLSPADITVAIDLDWKQYWTARSENPLMDAETLKLDDDLRIIEIGNKPTSFDEIEGQYIGLIKFSMKGLLKLRQTFHEAVISGYLGKKKVEKAYMTDILQFMINKGIEIKALPIRGGWIEIDTVDDLESKETRNRLDGMGLL